MIPTNDNDILENYEGYGIIEKISFLSGIGFSVNVNINIKNPTEIDEN